MVDLIKFTNGTVADADEVNGNYAFILTNMIKANLDGATSTSQVNYVENMAVNTFSNAVENTQNSVFNFGFTWNGWALTTDWTESITLGGSNAAGSVTFPSSGADIQCYASSCQGDGASVYACGDGTSGIDFKALGGVSECAFQLNATESGSGTKNRKLRIANSATGTSVDLIDMGASGTYDKMINLIFDVPSQQVRVFADGVEDASSPFSLSSLSNYYITLQSTAFYSSSCGSNTAKSYVIIRDFVYVDGTSGTGEITTNSETIESSSDVGVVAMTSTETSDGFYSIQVSADNGGSFDSFTVNTMTDISVAGTQIVFKITRTLPTTISDTTINLPWDNFAYGGYFG